MWLLVRLSLCLTAIGCTAAPVAQQPPLTADPFLRPGDRIRVTIPELYGAGADWDEELQVRADGSIAVPFLRQVDVAGLSEAEAARVIVEAYGPHARARVDVARVAVASGPRPEDGPAAPARRPGNDPDLEPLRAGDEILVGIEELDGPGINTIKNATVDRGGRIAVPLLNGIPVAGATPGEAAARIARAYRESNINMGPVRIRVHRVIPPPASHPVGHEGGGSVRPPTRPLLEHYGADLILAGDEVVVTIEGLPGRAGPWMRILTVSDSGAIDLPGLPQVGLHGIPLEYAGTWVEGEYAQRAPHVARPAVTVRRTSFGSSRDGLAWQVRVDDRLVLTISDLEGPGKNLVSVVTVAKDGTVPVPFMPRARVAGMSEWDAAVSLRKHYRDNTTAFQQAPLIAVRRINR